MIVRSSAVRDEARNKSVEDLDKVCAYSHMLGDDSDCIDGLAEAFLAMEPGTLVVCCRVGDIDWFFRGTVDEVMARLKEIPDCEEA